MAFGFERLNSASAQNTGEIRRPPGSKTVKRWFSFNIQGHETMNVTCRTVKEFGLCILQTYPTLST